LPSFPVEPAEQAVPLPAVTLAVRPEKSISPRGRRFALRADLVRTRIGAVRRRAGALIAGPVDANRIGGDACLSRTNGHFRLGTPERVSLAMLPEIMALVVAVAAVVVAAAAV
jgi:hypothetical protein